MNLSLKYWMAHKKRAMSIILSITISMASLVCAAFMARSASVASLEEQLDLSGNYDIVMHGVTTDDAQRICSEFELENSGVLFRSGYTVSASGKEFPCGSLADDKAVELYHFTPSEGAFPAQENEIAATRSAIEALGCAAQLGEKITVDLYNLEKNKYDSREFVISGILNDNRGYQLERIFNINKDGVFESVVCPSIFLHKNAIPESSEAHLMAIMDYGFDSEKLKSFLSENKIPFSNGMRIMSYNQFALTPISDLSETSLDDSLDTAHKDFNAKVVIPVFSFLVSIVSFISIMDVVSISMRERNRQLALLRCIGMSKKEATMRLLLEALVFVATSLIIGFALGAAVYWLIITFQIKVLGLNAYYAFRVSKIISSITLNPYIFPAVVGLISSLAAVSVPMLKNSSHSVLDVFSEASEKRSSFIRMKATGAVRLLSRKLNSGILQRISTSVIVIVVMSTSLFGYAYFSEQARHDTSVYEYQLEEANLNDSDYLAKRSFVSANCGTCQLNRHISGISHDNLLKLRESDCVKSVKYCIEVPSLKAVYHNNEENKEIIDSLSSSDISLSVEAGLSELYAKTLSAQGYNENERLFNIPCVGTGREIIESLSGYLTEGSINYEALESGKEVLIIETSDTSSPYQVGDIIPLSDVVIDDKTLESFDLSKGVLPEGYDYNINYLYHAQDGTQTDSLGFACGTRNDFAVRIAGRLVLDKDSAEFFMTKPLSGDCGFNLLIADSAFAALGLPDVNYTKVGVSLAELKASDSFDKVWYGVIAGSNDMEHFSTISTQRQISKAFWANMRIFVSMVVIIGLLGFVGIINTINFRVKKQISSMSVLRAIGARKWQLRSLVIRQNLRYPLIGLAFCWLPVFAFERVKKYIEAGLESGEFVLSTTVSDGKIVLPWYWSFPMHCELLEQNCVAVAAVIFILMIIIMLIASYLPIRWTEKQNIIESIRKSDF